MWRLKSCPRCNGDLFIIKEADGWYEHCLLCGYLRDVTGLIAADKAAAYQNSDASGKNSPGDTRQPVSSQS